LPQPLDGGAAGAIVVRGVPFIAAAVATENESRIRTYLRGVHGPSAWGSKMELKNRAMIGTGVGDHASSLVIIVHAAWQEDWIRAAIPAMTWRVVD
jgi:hypothetical protein